MTPHRFLTWDVGIWLSRVGAEVMADAENGHTTIRLAMSRNTRRSSDVNFFLFFSTIPMLGTLFRKGVTRFFIILWKKLKYEKPSICKLKILASLDIDKKNHISIS